MRYQPISYILFNMVAVESSENWRLVWFFFSMTNKGVVDASAATEPRDSVMCLMAERGKNE